MIKMFIDNEEVVCNKEFTIKEEMLSTSSTILNNCYPKSWEQDHDYISRFYYPKDYSKCLIYDEVKVPPPNLFNFDSFYSKSNNAVIVSQDNNQLVATVTTASTWQQIQYKVSNLETNTDYSFSFDFENTYDSELYQHSWMTIKGGTTNNNLFNAAYYKDDIITFNTGNYTEVRFAFHITINAPSVINTLTVSNVQLKKVGAMPTTVDNLIFAGMVKNSGDISLNPRYPKYCSLEILDFKDFLSTGDMLDFVISNKTITEAINMVVDTVSQYGFVLGNIEILNPDEVIGAYSTQNKTAYDVLQYLADISGSRWTTRMIDENTIAIDFYDPTLMPSGIDIDYTKEWWCNNKVIDLSFNYGTRDYRNKQVMLSDEVYGGVDYDETILADGYNTNFVTTTNIAKIKAISVNGSQVTVATTMDKDIGIEADFYYTPGENTIEASQIYSSGSQIVVGYTPLVKGREVVLNSAEISRINANTGRKGVIARYETRNDVLSSDELKMIGETYIKYKGSPEIILTLVTQMDIYNVGQSVYFNSPINELLTDYMVKKKSTEIIATTGDIFYTYELTSSFNSETAINWFDNQRNKVNGNISEGQSVVRNIDIEETANIIWDTLTITEVTVTGDNVLNSPLNSPFIQ